MAARPIRISVVVAARKAQRDLDGLSREVRKFSRTKIGGPTFDQAGFRRSYANPFRQAVEKNAAETQQARARYFRTHPAKFDAPVGSAPSISETKNVSFLRALRNAKALSGEARVSLAQLNQRVARFEATAAKSYNTASAKLEGYKETADRTTGRLKVMAATAVAVSVASRGISAATGYLTNAVQAASDLNETTSKAAQIFGSSTQSIVSFSDTASRSLGLSKSAALSAASSLGDMFLQTGFAQDQATSLSKSTLQLAADLGSFSNVDPSDVLDRISSAYRGEYDSLQALIPNISAARVQTEALALTHKKSASALTAQDKAIAVNSILLKDSKRAQGDFARTSDGLGNASRSVKAGFADLSANIGTALLPGVTAVAIAIRDKVLPALDKLVTQYAPKVNAAMQDLATNGFNASADLGQAGDAVKSIGQSLSAVGDSAGGALADSLTVTSIAVKFLAANAQLLTKALPYLVAGLIAYKLAQLAANVASTLNVPLKIAEILVNRQLVKSNQALIASRVEATAATVTNTGAEGAATVAKSRGIIATIASRAAMLAGAAATGVLTVSTGALNAVMALSPIGLVIIAIIALVAAFVLAYRKSDAFRAIVLKVFGALQSAVVATLGFLRKNWPLILAILTGPIGLAVLAFVKHRDKIIGLFRSIKSTVTGIFSGLGDPLVSGIKFALNAVIALVNKPIQAVNKIADKLPGVPSLPEIPALAAGGIVTRPTLALVGEAGPEAVVPLDGRFGGGDTYLTLNVTAGVGDPAEIGRTVVSAIRAHERRSGRRVLTGAA